MGLDISKDVRDSNSIQIVLQSAICLRVSNHLPAADKLLNSVQNPGTKKVLVPQWFELASNKEQAEKFRSVAQQNSDVEFVVFDPIWDMRLNKKTIVSDGLKNVKYLDDFDVRFWAQIGADFDEIWFLNLKSFLFHSFGKVFLLSAVLQSLNIVQNLDSDELVECFSDVMGIENCRNHLRLINTYDKEVSFRRQPNLWSREQQLAASVKLASLLEKTFFEELADMPSAIDGPLKWENTTILLPTNRTTHRPRIDQIIKFCRNKSINLCLLFHGKRDAQQIRNLDKQYGDKQKFVEIFHEENLGIGGGLNKAIEQASAPIWFKIDDDDDYSETFFREHYLNLRISNLEISSKKDCIYRRKESEALYLKKVSVLKSGTLATYRTMPGTSMAGYSETIRKAKFPEYSRYAFDRATTKKLRQCGVEIFSGSAFFFRINRFDTSMHTSPLQAGFWTNHCIELPPIAPNVEI